MRDYDYRGCFPWEYKVPATHNFLAATAFLPWKGLSCEAMSSWSLDMCKQTHRWWLNVSLSCTLEEKPSLTIWILNFFIVSQEY